MLVPIGKQAQKLGKRCSLSPKAANQQPRLSEPAAHRVGQGQSLLIYKSIRCKARGRRNLGTVARAKGNGIRERCEQTQDGEKPVKIHRRFAEMRGKVFWLPWGQRGQAGCASPSIPPQHPGVPGPARCPPRPGVAPGLAGPRWGLAGGDAKLWACKCEGLFDSARHFMWITVSPDTANNEAAWDIKAN